MSDSCLFCKISRDEVPSNKVYSDADTFAFRDINPQSPVHIIIIPKKHINALKLDDICQQDAALLGKIQIVAAKIASSFSEMKNGFRLVNNCGPDSGQTVYHIHYHLLGGRIFGWPPG
ncbi:MAG: HIT domain-containing protein [Elusimicrobiota bacterium]|jgi:histidine triad (HIT) family protein|nr:HIT domain-containing protein [Elusimicrobiota bacterium]